MVQWHRERGLRALLKRTISAQSHFLGLIAAAIGLAVLLHYVQASELRNESRHFWGCLIFGITSMMVFGSSALYHFLGDGFDIHPKLDMWLERLDHFAIYFFIAGTYTPVLINGVANPWGTVLMVTVWSVALLGVLYTHNKRRLPQWAQHRFVYTGIFLVMGWLITFRLHEIFHTLSRTTLIFLTLGGVSYSIGALIYATKRPKLLENVFGFHELWHIMVLLGYGFHYLTVLSFYV